MELTEQLARECLAARKTCVLFDHPNRGVIEVRGMDRIKFLHNILTNDIKNLSPARGLPACLLNAQAKIIAHMNVLCFDEFLWLAFDYALKDKLVQALNRMIIMDQVELYDRSEELKLISIHGPRAKEILERVLERSLPDELLSHISAPLTLPPPLEGEGKLICIRINLTGEIGYGLLIPKIEAPQVRTSLEDKGKAFGLLSIQPSTLEALRIEAGIPRYGVDFDETNIPLEAGLDYAISYAKGCFPGQEIIARLDSRGGVSKKLCGLELKGETAPKKNDVIRRDGKEVGVITSGVFSPTLKKTIAMGYLKKECWKVGCLVVVETAGLQIPARVAALPFYSS